MPRLISDSPGVFSRISHRKAELDRPRLEPAKGICILEFLGQRPRARGRNVHRLPCVVLDARGDFGLDVVRGDSLGGSFELTRLLLDLGHCRIALVNARRDNSTAKDRFAGYARALNESNIEVDEALLKWGSSLFYTMEYGAQATEELLGLPDPPTAIFAGNDFVALGVLGALTAFQIRVPDDMSVVSFDGITLPFLTAVIQPALDMGRMAAEMLYEQIQGYKGPPREHVLPVELRVSGSSGRRN